MSKEAAKNKTAATAPGVEHIREDGSPAFGGGRAPNTCPSSMTTLRGLAKNREHAMNAAPSRSLHEETPAEDPKRAGTTGPSNMATLRGLAKNREHAMNAAPSRSPHLEGEETPAEETSEEDPNNLPRNTGIEGACTIQPVLSSSPEATDPPPVITPNNRPPPPLTRGDTGLAVAQLVQDDNIDSPVMEAKEVDPDELLRREQKRRKFNLIIGCATVATGCFVLALALGLTLGKKNEKRLGVLPTAVPSQAPSGAPSPAPSGALDPLLQDLPTYTLESLMNVSSPQRKALDWLSYHPDLPGMKAWRKKQLFALATIYYAWNGTNWPNGLNEDWLDDTRDECLWFSDTGDNWDYLSESFLGTQGNQSCNEAGEFHALALSVKLSSQGLPFPQEIALLSNLAWIRLENIGLNVSLSEDVLPVVSLLRKLKSLELMYNAYGGSDIIVANPIPKEIGALSELRKLHLRGMVVTGTAPTEIGMLSNLEHLEIREEYNLTGPIPSELFQLTKLTYLDYTRTSLSGSLSSEIGLLTNLSGLNLGTNSLTGSIPTDIGLLTGLEVLLLSHNDFSGSIPSQIGQMTSLVFMNVRQNALSGQVPGEVSLATKFKGFGVSDNQLTGTIPRGLLLHNLSRLALDRNLFSGDIPIEMFSLTELTVADLKNNALSGTLPSEFGLMTQLGQVHFGRNLLTGTLPTQVGSLTLLRRVNFDSNLLSGHIPSELGLLTIAAHIYLQENTFSGQIPSTLTSLLELNKSSPKPFSGNFMAFLSQSTPDYLHELDVSNNLLLTGSVPDGLCSMNTPDCVWWTFDVSDVLAGYKNYSCSFGFDCTESLCGCDCNCTFRG